MRVAFRALAPSGLGQAFVRTAPDGEAEHHAMRRRRDGPFERWEAELPLRHDRLGWRFELFPAAGGCLHLTQRGPQPTPPFDLTDFVHLDQPLPVPWLPGATFYQIFPDRFARGGHAPWGAAPRAWSEGGHRDFCGGDLAGLRERLPYLEDLGVSAIYLCPVFEAPSNHRYDVQDYRRIDPRLGTNREFAALVRDLHARGQRVILDAVFNHVGSSHRWFNRAGRYPTAGAWQSQDSPWAEFFTFEDHPKSYHSWLGIDSLPKLNFASRRLRRELYAAPSSVAQRWLRPPYGIDGWRFDVANMLGRDGRQQLQREVWPELRRHLKAVRPDAYLLGEHFFDPTELLDGRGLDGSMNYRWFYFPVLRWLTGREPQIPRGVAEPPRLDYRAEHLLDELVEAYARLPFQISAGQFNLLGSHDTTRIKTHLGGSRELVMVAATLLMTWPGVPCIYYGDEVGLEGAGDPGCRGCMPWDEAAWDRDLRARFQALVRLRRRSAPLARGGLLALLARGDVVSYARVLDRDVAVVAVNRGRRPATLDVDVRALGLADGEVGSALGGSPGRVAAGRLRLRLPPASGDVLLARAGR